ncbi:MAG: GNAT family N-acetyltransferase [Chthoniobacterales bacterium]
MSSQVVIRPFQIEDYDAAARLWSEAEGVEISEGDSKKDIAHYLEKNPNLSRTAECAGVLVGVALAGHDGRRGYIYHLAVDPRVHQQGVGRRLVAECLAALAKLGLQRALILVADDNARAQEFWRRCGWEEIPEAKLMGIDLLPDSASDESSRESDHLP